MHHPFTSPLGVNAQELKANPASANSNAYDMVINGYEVGGGSVRIHNAKCRRQYLIFWVLKPKSTAEVWFLAGCA